MADVGIALIVVLGLFVLGFFFGSVLFKILLWDPELQNLNIGKYVYSLAISIIFLIIGAFTSFLGAIASFVNNVNTNWRIYLFIGFVAIAAEVELEYGPQIFMTIDQGNTEFAVPVYQLYIINITNVLRVLYDIIICWLNLINSLTTILIQSIANIGYNCTMQNWQLVIDTFLTALEAIFFSLGNFILSLGANDLDLIIPTQTTAAFIGSFNNFFVCACLDLSFFTTWAIETLNDPSLPVAFNGFINADIELFRLIITTVKDMFYEGFDFFTCAGVTPDSARILCMVFRPPVFNIWSQHGCDGYMGGMEFIDAAIRNGIHTFIPGDFPVPRISPLVSNVTCAGAWVFGNLLDTAMHFDLFFPFPSYPHNINYLHYLDVDTPILHGQLAAGGINIFFTDINVTVTDNIGCFFASGANFSVNYASMTTKIIIQLTVDPANILTWLMEGNAPTGPFENDAMNMALCAEGFAKDINPALGQWTVELANLTIAFSHVITDTLPQMFEFATWFISENFFLDITSVFFNLDALSIASGNVVRQMDHNGMNTTACPLTNPTTGQNDPIVTELELFCCSGALIDASMRLINAVVSYFTLSLIDLIDGIPVQTVFGAGGDGDLTLKVIPRTKDTLDALACILPSFFDFVPGGSACPGEPIGQISIVVYVFFASLLELILSIPQAIALILNILVLAITGHHFQTSDICNYLILFYNMTIGAFASVVLHFCQTISCFIASDGVFDQIGASVDEIFGPGGTLVGLLCASITSIFQAIQITIGLFTNASGFANAIYNLIATDISNFFNMAIGSIQAEINVITGDVDALFNCITNLGGFLNMFFSEFALCISSCFEIPACNQCNFNTPTCNLRRSAPERELAPEITNILSYSLASPQSPCYAQIQSANNPSYTSDLRRLFKVDARNCIQSVLLAKTIDRTLLRLNNTLPTIVDPMTFYDSETRLQTIRNLTHGLRVMFDFSSEFIMETMDYNGNIVPNQSVYFGTSWDSYAATHHVQDALSIRLGEFNEIFLYGFKNQEEGKQGGLLITIWNVLYSFWKMFINIWKVPGNLFSQAKRGMEYYPRAKDVSYKLAINITRSSGYKVLTETFASKTEYGFGLFKDWFVNKSHTTDQRLLSNRRAFWSAYTKIKNRIDYNRDMYGMKTDEEKNITIKDKRMGLFIPTPSYIYDVRSQRNGSMVESMNSHVVRMNTYQQRDFPLPCIDGVCLNCTLLDLVLNRFVDALFMCLNDSQRFIDPSPYFAQNGNAIQKPPNTIFVLPNLGNITQIQDGPTNTNDLAIQFLTWITFSKVDWFYIGDYLAYFFQNNNASDVNSWEFWVVFLVECNITSMTRCELNPPGLGFWKGLGYSIAVYLIILTVFGLVLPAAASNVATYGLLIIPFGTIIAGYLMSPWCLIPKPPLGLPLLPNCLADDIFEGLWSINGNCINWETSLPGLTTPICPTSAEDFKRTFNDWKQPPFLFTDGIRNIFFLIEWQAPSVNNFLRTTDIILFSWIREINYLNQYLQFDFGPAGITPQWISFFYITLPSVIVPLFLGFIIVLALFFIVYPILLFLAGLLGVIAAAVLLLVALIVGVFGTATNTLSFYRDVSNFDFIYVKRGEKSDE